MKTFSRSSAWVAYLCSFYAWLLLYKSTSFLWIWIAIVLFITFLSITLGIDKVVYLLGLPKPLDSIIRLLKISLATSFFLSSVYGAISILYSISYSDKSILLIPTVVLIFFFGGASIGIYQSKRNQ